MEVVNPTRILKLTRLGSVRSWDYVNGSFITANLRQGIDRDTAHAINRFE